MKIRFRLLAAGLLLCPVALSGARAETASRSSSQSSGSSQRAEAAKKKSAAKPADAKKPGASSTKATASSSTATSTKSKPSAAQASKPAARVTAKTPPRDSAKDNDKPVASAKKPSSPDKTKDQAKAKTATASTSKPAAKPGKSPSKPEKPAPEKIVAKAQSGKKKTSAASSGTPLATRTGKPASGSSRVGTTAATVTKAGKKSKAAAAAQDRDDRADDDDKSVIIRLADESSSSDANLPPAPPPLFVPTGLGLRLFGMPTGLPDVQSPTTTLLNMAMLKAPAGSRTTNTGAVSKTTTSAPAAKPAAPLKLIDPQAARAAMQAVAKKQSAFRPALADAAARRSSLPVVEEAGTPSLSYLTGPVAFVTKSAPPLAAGTADNFWGSSGDWLFSHAPAAAPSKASTSKGKAAGAVASSASIKAGAAVPPQAQVKSRPLPAAVPAAAPVPVPVPTSPAPADAPEPLAQAPSLSRPEMPPALAKAAAVSREGDLSERERAFVRSLTEAAERVEHSHHLGDAADSTRAGSDPRPAAATPAAADRNTGRARSMPASATISPKSGPVSETAGFVLTGGENEANSSSHADSDSGPGSAVPAPGKAVTGSTIPALHLAGAESASGIQHSQASAASAPPADRLPEALPAFAAAASGKVDIQSEGQTEYDQAANKVIYTGKVELNSRAVRLRGDRVEVFLKQGGGIARLEASGHVVLRTQATAKSSGHMASAGHAAYDLTSGEITLSDWPKIQGDSKSHVSTAASTTMVLKADGRALTNGPNRTLISN